METGEHIPEDLLELYSLGRLAEAEAAKVEEHLLACEVCREELQAADEFIAALRSALKENPSLGGGSGR